MAMMDGNTTPALSEQKLERIRYILVRVYVGPLGCELRLSKSLLREQLFTRLQATFLSRFYSSCVALPT